MILPLTYTAKQQLQIQQAWNGHQDILSLTYGSAFTIGQLIISETPQGNTVMITDWRNGHPTIMPPADIVSVSIYIPDTNELRMYLLDQKDLLERASTLVKTQHYPTLCYIVSAITPEVKNNIIRNAWLAGATPLVDLMPTPQTA